MKIKIKLTINFTVLVAFILAISFFSVYLYFKTDRQNEFINKLRLKSLTSATLFLNVEAISSDEIKKIDDNTTISLGNLNVWVLDTSKIVLYSKTDSETTARLMPSFNYMRWNDNNFRLKNDTTYYCIVHNFNDVKYYVLATAVDFNGIAQLKKLRLTLFSILGISLLLTFFAGIVNTWQSLRPIKELIRHVDEIKATNLDRRLDVSSKDEIAELSRTFNNMLERIERAFETEKMFVSNASHELRTPVTSIKGQVEVALIKPRTEVEYKTILSSIHEDTKNLTIIINGFLELAEANIEPGFVSFQRIRVDELLFSVKDEYVNSKPGSIVNIEFENIPDEENNIMIQGNVRLLKILFKNLIDNACKFSENKKTVIKIGFDQEHVILKFIDSGIGIPKDEIGNIFQPLYRSKNAAGRPGSGIGLSIVDRIAAIHDASMHVNSELNVGTTISIKFLNVI